LFKKIINTVLLACALWLAACGKEKKVEIPANVLSKEKFTKVLVDYALAEASANMNIKDSELRKVDSVYAFNPLKENKVSKAQYDTTLAFYANHTDLYKQIYEDVLTELSKLQTNRDSLKAVPTKTLPASK